MNSKIDELLGMLDMFTISIVVIVSWIYIHWSKLIKLYTLNMCSLFYTNFSSIKLTLKNNEISVKW